MSASAQVVFKWHHPSCLASQTANWKVLHSWPAKLDIDFATFCGTYVELKTASADAIKLTTLHSPMEIFVVLTTL